MTCTLERTEVTWQADWDDEPDQSGWFRSEFAHAHISNRGGCFHVGDVRVDSEHRRQGHGRRLMEAIIAHANNRGYDLELEVWADNIPAIRMYESLGFIVAYEFSSEVPWRSVSHYRMERNYVKENA